MGYAMRMGDKLVGNEDVWEAGLQQYQRKREQEVDDLAALSLEDIVRPLTTYVDGADEKERLRIQGALRANGRSNGLPTPVEEAKPFFNPKGTVGDRINQSARAGPSTESPPQPKKPLKSRKSKDPRDRTTTAASVRTTLEDELLGLVEGEEDHPGGGGSRPGASSPPPYSDDDEEEYPYENDELNAERFDPDMIVQPSGLTRAEIIAKVTRGNMAGLTEQDVKAVQDEMWLREKAAGGGAPMNKDGTVRRKPGPAKGWKKLRGGIDWDERSEGTSVGDSTINGERDGGRKDTADAEIAALLGEDEDDADETFTPGSKKLKPKALKKRKLGSEGGLPEGSELDFSEDERKKVVGKKGKSRPTLLGSELQLEDNASEAGVPEPQPEVLPPNVQDPRGVSEAEARHRLNVVEDLEKVVWASICRDIPRVRLLPPQCLSARLMNRCTESTKLVIPLPSRMLAEPHKLV
jgi:DNA helicase INO80